MYVVTLATLATPGSKSVILDQKVYETASEAYLVKTAIITQWKPDRRKLTLRVHEVIIDLGPLFDDETISLVTGLKKLLMQGEEPC